MKIVEDTHLNFQSEFFPKKGGLKNQQIAIMYGGGGEGGGGCRVTTQIKVL